MLITTNSLEPDRLINIVSFDKKHLGLLPADYIAFLQNFGAGTYCDEVVIDYPDTDHIFLTFGDRSDLREFDEFYSATDLIKSIQIGWSVNGDIICVTAQRKGKVFILPRQASSIKSFTSFFDAIKFLLPDADPEYFDPTYDSAYEQINLITESGLIDILPIRQAFLEKFKFDFVVNEATQPKYIIKAFGGWIMFDLIYKNSITLKFQNQYKANMLPLLHFLAADKK